MARVTALLSELESELRVIYPTITFGFGEKDIPRVDSGPPRVVWIITKATHTAPENRKTNPKPILTRNPMIVAHCWNIAVGATDPKQHFDACEELVHNLIFLLRKAATVSVEMMGEEWSQSDHDDFGHAALVSFAMKTSVENKAYATVQCTTIASNTVGSLAGDTNVDWDEP